MIRHSLTRAVSLGTLALLAACDAQTLPEYQGEPIATLQGTVTSDTTVGHARVDAAILWVTFNDESNPEEPGMPDWFPKQIGMRVAVDGTFPAGFQLDVYTPPPASAEVFGKEVGVWMGVIGAVLPGSGDDIKPADVIGVDPLHIVYYFSQDGTENEAVASLATIAKVPATRGYHLAKKDPTAIEAELQEDICRWNGVCARLAGGGPTTQSFVDWQYERCTDAFPERLECTGYLQPSTPAEEEETGRCERLASTQKRYAECARPTIPNLPNPDDLGDPVTIQVGTSIWDAL